MENDMRMGLTLGMSGHFLLEAVRPNGERRHLADFKNLILDQGLIAATSGTQSGFIQHAQVGSGSTAPSPSQTRLVSRINSTNNIISEGNNYFTDRPSRRASRWTWRFTAGQAAGNIAEVGVGWLGSGDTLFSRALVLDGNGNPTTVTVLSDESLDVTYTLNVFPSEQDSLATLNIGGVSYETIFRISRAQRDIGADLYPRNLPVRLVGNTVGEAYTGGIGDISGSPTGASAYMALSDAKIAGAEGTPVALRRMTIPLERANLQGGIKSMEFGVSGVGTYQIQFTPPLPKTANDVLTLDIKLTFARR